MKTLNDMVRAITSPTLLDELADLIRSHDESFPQEEEVYQEAVTTLKELLPASTVDEYIRAWQTEVVANILYAGRFLQKVISHLASSRNHRFRDFSFVWGLKPVRSVQTAQPPRSTSWNVSASSSSQAFPEAHRVVTESQIPELYI